MFDNLPLKFQKNPSFDFVINSHYFYPVKSNCYF